MTEAINNSLVTGGTKGIGSVITEVLRDRGDRVITISRGKMNDENHVEMDLSSIEDISSLPNRIASVDIHNLVFCHRYRGNNWGEEFQVSLEAVNLVIENVKKKLASVSSIVIIGSNATILPVRINNNIVIGAGSVVTKNLLRKGIYIGNPAKLLKKI